MKSGNTEVKIAYPSQHSVTVGLGLPQATLDPEIGYTQEEGFLSTLEMTTMQQLGLPIPAPGTEITLEIYWRIKK